MRHRGGVPPAHPSPRPRPGWPGQQRRRRLVAGATCTTSATTSKCVTPSAPKPIYEGLVTQLETLGVEFLQVDDVKSEALVVTHDVVVDALFGFSFRGEPRHPFDELLEILNPHSAPPPIVAVDVPSGWSVDEGDVSGEDTTGSSRQSHGAEVGRRDLHGAAPLRRRTIRSPTLASDSGSDCPPTRERAVRARGREGGFSFGGGAARRRRGSVAAPAGDPPQAAGILGQQLGRIRRGIDPRARRGERANERDVVDTSNDGE